MRGGETLAEKGLSVARRALRVIIIAEGRSFGVAVIALSMSAFSNGVPLRMLAEGQRRGEEREFLFRWRMAELGPFSFTYLG